MGSWSCQPHQHPEYELHQVVAGARMGLLQHFDREQHVGRSERLAVMPGHARLQLEGVGFRIVADTPALGQAWLRGELLVVAQQAFIDIAGHHLGRAVLDLRQHQAGRLRLDHGVDGAARFRGLRAGDGGGAAAQHQAQGDRLQHIASIPRAQQRTTRDDMTFIR